MGGKNILLLDLDGTVLVKWTHSSTEPHEAPWLDRVLSLGTPAGICTNQGGVSWSLAGGRPGRKYPSWPEILLRIRAGMRATGVALALVALHHPGAAVPKGTLLLERAREISLPLPLAIARYFPRLAVPVAAPEGIVIASWAPSWRKPEPAMLQAARRLYSSLHPAALFSPWIYIGDEESDREAAARAGMRFLEVKK